MNTLDFPSGFDGWELNDRSKWIAEQQKACSHQTATRRRCYRFCPSGATVGVYTEVQCDGCNKRLNRREQSGVVINGPIKG